MPPLTRLVAQWEFLGGNVHAHLVIALLIWRLAPVRSAADLRPMPVRAPPPMQAVYTWTGFYLGVNVGGGWSNANSEFSIAGFPAFATSTITWPA